MTDQDNAISAVMEFLNDNNKRTLLVRGYDNDAKVKVVLGCLEKVFQKGIIKTSSMKYLSDHIKSYYPLMLFQQKIIIWAIC